MSNQTEAETGLARSEAVASFEHQHTFLSRIQHALHSNPALVPLIVLVLSIIVSVDGGCPGVANVRDGVIGATSQQYPLQMAALGVEAIKAWADTGEKPAPTEGKDFFDTGVKLVTDTAVDGVESIDSATGADLCWG